MLAEIAEIVVEGTVTIRLRVPCLHPSRPPAPTILGIDFTPDPNGTDMAAQHGHIRLSPAPPEVTSRPCRVTLNGGEPITVDMIDPNATFDCTDDDHYSVVVQDVSPGGTSQDSPPFTGTVPTGGPGPGPGGPPPTPTILGVDFTPA